MIRKAVSLHLFITALLGLGCAIFGSPQQGRDAVFAGLLVGANLVIIAWSLNQIIIKKSVALATGVIVIKYAALISVFYLLHNWGWRFSAGFVIGFASLFPTIGLIVLNYTKKSEYDGTL